MGSVWRARDEILDRLVAVKEIRIDELAGEESEIQRERSLREARATARIDHPNVVRVHDVAEEGDRLWIVMQLVNARSLEQILVQDGPLAPEGAARIGRGLVRALHEVHAVGVLHRDIKPGNVLIDERGEVVLTDFGIASMQDLAGLTMAGMLIGSPDYMAPERVEGKTQGPPSDLWSLGATLCAALAGQSPFTRPTTLATLHAVLYEEPQIPPAAGPLRELLAALLRKSPQDRPTLPVVAQTLTALFPADPPESRTPTVARPPSAPPAEAPPVEPEPEPAAGPGTVSYTPTVADVPAEIPAPHSRATVNGTPGAAEVTTEAGEAEEAEETAEEEETEEAQAPEAPQEAAPEAPQETEEVAPEPTPAAATDLTEPTSHEPEPAPDPHPHPHPDSGPEPAPEPDAPHSAVRTEPPEQRPAPEQEQSPPDQEQSPQPDHKPPPRPAEDQPLARTRRPARRALLAAGTVAASAAAVAGIMLATRGGGTDNPPVQTATSRPPTQASATDGARRFEEGFNWVPPAGFNRTQESPRVIRYFATDGTIEISARQKPQEGGDLLANWQQFEAQQHNVPGYQNLRLERTTFQGKPAVIWEFAFLRNGETPAHGRQLGFRTKGRTYSLNMWYLDSAEATALRIYDRVSESFRTS